MSDHKMISHYQILGAAGHGGMAAVYLAQDIHINRQVVIKVLPNHFGHNPQFRQRFLQEAQVMVNLSHPNIVPVYEYGEEGDQPFLIMGYMSGGTLQDRIKQGPISLTAAIEILTPIASAIDYAHSKGIVHRDMKPSNILFSESGAAYLADFGLAKLAETTQSLTGSAIVGTPAYMSPEQVRSDRQIDGRSDIYSMGVILYEMLSGEVPYKADTTTQQLMMHILEPTPAIRQIRQDVAPQVEAALQRAMAKDPRQRYQSAGAFINDLNTPRGSHLAATIIEPMVAVGAAMDDAAIARKSVPAAPLALAQVPDSGYEPQPAVKSGRKGLATLFALIAIALVVLILIGGFVIWFDRQNRQALAGAEIDDTVSTAEAATTADSDGDGILNVDEQGLCTDPENPDSDSDGLSDKTELDGWQTRGINYTSDPCKADSDGDGLLDGEERSWGTDPILIDSDGDTLTDGEEINSTGSSPLNPDTDGDGTYDNVDSDPGQLPAVEDTPVDTAPPSPTPTDAATHTPTHTLVPSTETPTTSPTATAAPTMTPTPGLVTYTITVHTGCEFLAGTDANVYIKLFGDRGESNENLLDNPGVNDHEACDSHNYQISLPDLGDINTVRIRHDNSGFAAGWFLDGVFIRNEVSGEERYFSNNQWLATDEGDGRISRDLPFR